MDVPRLLLITAVISLTVSDLSYENIKVLPRQDHLPDFDKLSTEHSDSLVVFISTFPITKDHFENGFDFGLALLKVMKMYTGLDQFQLTFTAKFLDNKLDLYNFAHNMMTQTHYNNITILQAYCPTEEYWSHVVQAFPINKFPHLRLLRLSGSIPQINETFFMRQSNLFYLDLRLKTKISIHPNTLVPLSKLAFLILTGSDPSSNISNNILCPLSTRLEAIRYIGYNNMSLFQCKYVSFDHMKSVVLDLLDIRNIQSFDSTIFRFFPNTQLLYIKSRSLMSIDTTALHNLPRLQFLYISMGNITTPNIPALLQNLPKLTILHLMNNNIENIDGSFKGSLKFINLSLNKIITITNHTFVNCKNLNFLNLSGNAIEIIASQTFPTQYSLLWLDLSRNHITTLEKGCFKSLVSVENLTLSHNYLTNLTNDIFRKNTFLITTINKMTYTGITFENLRHLALSHNLITHIDEDAFNFPKLKHLFLSHNKLSHLSPRLFQNVPQLQLLDLSHNDLHSITHNVFHNILTLQSLDLSHNDLHIITHNVFHNILTLQTLDLSSNHLSSLPCDLLTSHPPHTCPSTSSLIALDLSNNHLTNQAFCIFTQNTCPTHQTFFHNLRYLYLHNNSLTSINVSKLNTLVSLQSFSINNNPLRCDCDLVPFTLWMTRHPRIVYNPPNTSATCVSDAGTLYPLLGYVDCTMTIHHTISNHTTIHTSTTLYNHKALISLSVIFVSAIIVAIFCGYFRMEIAAILYARTGLRLRRHNPEFADKRYNVMIWCHDRDMRYANQILQVLQRYFRVYWNQRDCTPGEPVAMGFERGITSSERVIVILTRNFVTDGLCQLNFENLQVSLGRNDFSAVLIVADDDVITHKHRLYERIRAYVRTRQYLRHNDRLFWKKLLYKLPRPQDDTEPILYRDLQNPEINFDRQRPLEEMLMPADNEIEMAEVNVDDDVNPNNVYVDRMGQDIGGYENDRLVQ